MYASGAAHPYRDPCRTVLAHATSGRLDALTSAEVVQEILHRFSASDRAEGGAELASSTLDLFSPVLPTDHSVMVRMPDLVRRYPQHTARDLVHVATCVEHAISTIISSATDFDAIEEIERVDPSDVDRLLR